MNKNLVIILLVVLSAVAFVIFGGSKSVKFGDGNSGTQESDQSTNTTIEAVGNGTATDGDANGTAEIIINSLGL